MKFYEFNNYWYLLFILILLGFFGLAWIQKNKKEKNKILFRKNWNKKNVLNIVNYKIYLLLIAVLLLLLAVWRPQWGQGMKEISKKGLDVVFAVDVSKSMKALDFSEGRMMVSRLDATKFLINNFIKNRKSDRIGLVEFAGESFVASPLTLDHSVFESFLENISSDDIGKQGTNLAEALEISIARLDINKDRDRSKAIILFSDGDETINSQVEKIAKLAKEKGIKIYTVGIGSESGMPIPEGQNSFGEISYKRYHGKRVITKLNPEPLKKIAEITDGDYMHAENISDLKSLQKKLEALPQKILHDTTPVPQAEKYFYFTLLSLILYIIGFLLPKNISILKVKK